MLLFRHVTKVLAKEKQHPIKMRYLHHVVYTRIGVCLKYESDFLTKMSESDFNNMMIYTPFICIIFIFKFSDLPFAHTEKYESDL
jgi:hypothetical protein